MAGGLIQMTGDTNEDIFLVGNPQISFFKIAYRRYTNFAMESVRQEFLGNTNFGGQMSCTVDKAGDLMNTAYLEIELPEVSLVKPITDLTRSIARSDLIKINSVYSQINDYLKANTTLARKLESLIIRNNISMTEIILIMSDTLNFVDLRNLLLQRCKLIDFIKNSADFRDVEILQTEKCNLLNLIKRADVKILFDSIVLRTARDLAGLTDEEIADVQREELSNMILNDIYPVMQQMYEKIFNLKVIQQRAYDAILKGTYQERFDFAWVEEIGHSIIDNLQFRIGSDIIDTHTGDWFIIWNSLTLNQRQRHNYNKMIGQVPILTTFDSNVKPGYRLIVPLQFWFNRHTGSSLPLIALRYHDVVFDLTLKTLDKCCYTNETPESLANAQVRYNINIQNINLYVNYIYLDGEERRRFAQTLHEYLIEVVQYNEFPDIFETSYNAECDFFNPCKFLVWFCQPTHYRENQNGRNKCQWNNFGLFRDKSGGTLENTYIRLNSYNLTSDTIGPKYYNFVQPYQHFRNSPNDGLYNYSFALYPMELQPSGTCNMSRIKQETIVYDFSPEFLKKVEETPQKSAYLAVYTMSYNILRIVAGMGKTVFN